MTLSLGDLPGIREKSRFMFNHRIHNFSAGPAAIPEPVLLKAKEELLNFAGTGMSVMEMSHRSKEFEAVLERALSTSRELMGVPDTHAILLLQGGASLQFSMVPMNLCENAKPVDMLHTGAWTEKAIKEIKRVAPVNMVFSGENTNFMNLPDIGSLKFSSEASFVYMCSNNTIFGTEYNTYPDTGNIPLVADMSSNILSRPFDVSRFGLVFAGAQKNMGPSGITMVIIRKDLVERAGKELPTMLQYRTHLKDNSLYNTPPTFGIYMLALTTEWVKEQGGLSAIEKINSKKAQTLYEEIDRTGFYSCPVNKPDRSRMNVVFRIKGGNEDLEKKFVASAEKAGLSGLKGHRSVGGLRASVYNAVPQSSIETLVSFMKDFEKNNG